jgi:hypothetical protein
MSLIVKKCCTGWLNKALNATTGSGALTLETFIIATEFKIDEWSMKKFYYNIQDDLPIYLDESTIKWIGYSIKHK